MFEEIKIHTEEEFAKMRVAGRVTAEILDYITDFIAPGITTDEINELCHKKIESYGGIAAPLGYKGYPKSVCTSLNYVVCHGIPSEKKLKEGDILNIDVSVIIDGWVGDSSRMYLVGDKVSIKAKRLVQAAYDCMMKGIEVVKPGVKLNEVGRAIEAFIKPFGYGVVRDFCGHGIGQKFHAPPNVCHFYSKSNDIILEEGMFFTVEPMINAGDFRTLTLSDGWTAISKDRSLSAQFEHTIAVTSDGFEIFTLSPKGYTAPPYVL